MACGERARARGGVKCRERARVMVGETNDRNRDNQERGRERRIRVGGESCMHRGLVGAAGKEV